MYNIKDMVKDGKKARITHYKLGELWYETECGFKFPVPVHNTEEIGEATFLVEDKAMLLMRYIRKHIKFLEDSKVDQELDAYETPLPTVEELATIDGTLPISMDVLKSAGLLGKVD